MANYNYHKRYNKGEEVTQDGRRFIALSSVPPFTTPSLWATYWKPLDPPAPKPAPVKPTEPDDDSGLGTLAAAAVGGALLGSMFGGSDSSSSGSDFGGFDSGGGDFGGGGSDGSI